MTHCPACFAQKFCRRWLVVTPDELRNPHFVIDARNFIHGRMVRHNITPGTLLDRLLNTVSLMEGDFRNGAWGKIDLPIHVFEVPDADIDAGRGAVMRESILDWVAYNFGRAWDDRVNAQLHGIGQQRFIVIASLARAIWWQDVQMWGIRAANDNDPKP
ncbi:MAG: hypothetical protein JKY46_08605 [Robiginitomaculum sp.]|nr:hypothetical protein [Robiginitomaculum sp.]